VRERNLAGNVTVTSRAGTLVIVNRVALESLVASGVRAELIGHNEIAALEAAAIAIRSFIVASGARHGDEGFDFCDTTHCFHSQGDVRHTDPAWLAASSTRGTLLEYRQAVLPGYVTGACGGGTSTPQDIWGSASSGFAPVVCNECRTAKMFAWTRTIRARDLVPVFRQLGVKFSAGSPIGIEAGSSGWARFIHPIGGPRVRADAFRIAIGRRLGWDALPSSRFAVQRSSKGYVFTGGGHGHGVGLCLAGSVSLARKGYTSSQILERYFPLAGLTQRTQKNRPPGEGGH
jgi:stage II sporulation protein D